MVAVAEFDILYYQNVAIESCLGAGRGEESTKRYGGTAAMRRYVKYGMQKER